MTRNSETLLSAGDVDLWYDWLRAGLIAYTASAPVPDRYDAFAPLLVDPQSATPAGDLVEEIRSVAVERSGVAEGASIEALRTWSLPVDGWRPAVLLVSVAARLGGRGLAEAIYGLVGRSAGLPPEARAELAYVAVQAACMRYKRNEIFSLADLLWREKLCIPSLVADLALLMARPDFGGLREMPRTLADMLPELMTPPHTGDVVDAIARALRLRLGPEDLIRGLAPVDNEEPNVAGFRSVLLRNASPSSAETLALRRNVVAFEPPPGTTDRVLARLKGIDNLGQLTLPEASERLGKEVKP